MDGDTLRLSSPAGELRVRLSGIDTPERDQPCTDAAGAAWRCGAAAGEALAALVAGAEVRCQVEGRDRFRRLLARCRAGGQDLGAAMVGRGLALADRRYSDDHAAHEEAARDAARGVWSGAVMPPAGWRQTHGARAAGLHRSVPPAAGDGDCAIKGNVSTTGRIYHLPGSRDYARTRIDRMHDERWFCSEAEAQLAGWRAARE